MVRPASRPDPAALTAAELLELLKHCDDPRVRRWAQAADNQAAPPKKKTKRRRPPARAIAP